MYIYCSNWYGLCDQSMSPDQASLALTKVSNLRDILKIFLTKCYASKFVFLTTFIALLIFVNPRRCARREWKADCAGWVTSRDYRQNSPVHELQGDICSKEGLQKAQRTVCCKTEYNLSKTAKPDVGQVSNNQGNKQSFNDGWTVLETLDWLIHSLIKNLS